MRDIHSCPNSPARCAERWEIENDHLKQQITLLQFELDNRRRMFLLAVQEINATHETRARVRIVIFSNHHYFYVVDTLTQLLLISIPYCLCRMMKPA